MHAPQPAPAQKLEEAFAAFNRLSHELDTSYRALQERVARLTEELAEARGQRLRELAEKERLADRLRLMMDALPGGLVRLDKPQFILEANPEAEILLADSESKIPLAGQHWPQILQRVAAQVDDQEMVLGCGRRLRLTQRPLAHEGETLVLLTDVSELHALQQQASREQRLAAVGETAARLAHQIRTPLSTALLHAGHLQHDQLPAAKRRDLAEKITGRLLDMDQLVASMLAYVRGETGQIKKIALPELVSDIQALVLPPLKRVQGTLDITGNNPLVEVTANRESLVCSLVNLVMNALEIVGTGVYLHLQIETDASSICFKLHDNGPGIEEALINRIFDPFFTTRARGTGLGLAIVAMTASSHQGEAWAENNPSGGACFTLKLPLRDAGVPPSPGHGLWQRETCTAKSTRQLPAKAAAQLRSLDVAERNPGTLFSENKIPDSAPLHPGYRGKAND